MPKTEREMREKVRKMVAMVDEKRRLQVRVSGPGLCDSLTRSLEN